MSERGKKVNKNNPKVKQERRTRKRAERDALVDRTIAATQGISPRPDATAELDFPATDMTTGAVPAAPKKCETCGVDLVGKDTVHKDKKHVVKSGKNRGARIDYDPSTGEPKIPTGSDMAVPMPKFEDVGEQQRGKTRRVLDKLQEKSDAAAIAEARREKTPEEQAAADAAATGASLEEVMAVREGRASFIDAKPKEDKNLVDVTDQLTSADVDQPSGAWSQGTKTGIFTPAPTGAIRGNRAQPTPPAVQENTQERVESGRGLAGMGANAESQTIMHPIHGEMQVPADIARAHRLYDAEWKNNPAQANRLAGISGAEDYASPYQHKGGHYERLGRLQAAGQDISTIPAYARKMGQTVYDVVESQHALLQDKLDSQRMVNYGMQHLHPEDTFTHPETGATHPMSEWSTVHNMPLTGEGLPDLSATKGTNTSIYTDRNGNQQTTVPTHLGWWKTPTDGRTDREDLGSRPGNWSFRSNVIPLDSKPLTAPVPAYDFVAGETAKALPVGSKQSRAQISEAARAMAEIASASGVKVPDRINSVQVTDSSTGLPLDEPKLKDSYAQDTFVTTDTPAEDSTVYKRKGRGKNVIKDVNHLVSQQLAATVGGGTETGTGETTRSGEVASVGGTAATQGRSRGFVPAPIISTTTDGASAFQPGKKELAGTAEENLELHEKLTNQEGVPGSSGRGHGDANMPVAGVGPAYRVDASGNPIPNPPKVGVKGARRFFTRGRTTVRAEGQGNQVSQQFDVVHGLGTGVPGPAVTSGSSVDGKMTNPGMVGWSSPLAPSGKKAQQLTLFDLTDEELRKKSEYESVHGTLEQREARAADTSTKPTMTAADASKYNRVYLEDNPDKGPAQPMLDFGAPEREEEEKRRVASKANGGVDVTTGKRFKRQGQQWGFLDTRWLGNIGETSEDLGEQVSQENRAEGSAHPRAVIPAPSGLPKAGPRSAPVDTNGAGPSTLRILGEMHGSSQISAALAKLRGGADTSEESDKD